MAKATITCTCPDCGTTFVWSVVCHNRREADNWESYHADEATTRLCPECYRKAEAARREQAREAENKAAAENAAELGLPALAGTERQVAWAISIRQKALDEALFTHGGTLANLNDKGRAVLAAAMAKLPTDARWWIDHRDDAAHRATLELECASWALLPEDKRAAKLAKVAEWEAVGTALERSTARGYRTYERARLSGRSYFAQHEADEAEATR